MAENVETALENFKKSAPAVVDAFQGLHDAAFEEGALSVKEKRLIMVGIAAALRCEPCIRRGVRGALEAGASHEEIVEAGGVAVLMGGAPTTAYCALYLMDELEKASQDKGGKP